MPSSYKLSLVSSLALLRISVGFITSETTLSWGGREWYVKEGLSLPGPKPLGNMWSGEGISVDERGALHLGHGPLLAASVEIWEKSPTPLGYGTYSFAVTVPKNLDKYLTFGMFTWDDDIPGDGNDYAGDAFHREIDVEVGRWGWDEDPNAYQFVVQPWGVAENIHRQPFPLVDGEENIDITFSVLWGPQRVIFSTLSGHGPKSVLINQWDFPARERVPRPGGVLTAGARVHLNLWSNDALGASRATQVVVHAFNFTPL